jgi:hypothetical protein
MTTYFTKEIKPTIAASKQHAGAFGSGTILFDWTEFKIPSGGAKLIGASVLVRPKGDATPTANNFALGVLFSKGSSTGAPSSIGTVQSVLDNTPRNDYMGVMEFASGNFGPATSKGTVIAQSSGASGSGSFTPIVFSQENSIHRSASEDTFYIAGFSNSNSLTFESINAIAETGAADAASTQVITMDGTGMDVREHFIAGDIVHIGTSVGSPAADSLIGTVASADSATQITLEAVSPTALVDGDILYNIHPVRVLLHFEK